MNYSSIMKACVIAAPMSGSGKTTVTIGLLSALRSRGLQVQAFKVGPDFIDTGLHALATGRPSHNLDGWMLSRETNLELFAGAAAGKDVAVVEGVMGLFDGASGSSNSGSTAEMAGWLGLPVILVIDAHVLARSVAAIVHGFQTFDPSLQIAGVILNRVAGEGHFRLLADALKDVRILGWLPDDPEIRIAERHLGLLTAGEIAAQERVERIGSFFASHVDVDRILDALPQGKGTAVNCVNDIKGTKKVRVALAVDAAFSFYYQANRTALENCGAEIVEFSPLRDAGLPDADFLYIGGGYPELYRSELERNRSMRQTIRRFIESGKRFYAECGGLMYLSKSIDGSEMVGILPTDIHLTDRLVDFGYCDITTRQASIFGPADTAIRGHQFHYSKATTAAPDPVYNVKQRTREYAEGWLLPNGIASYVHLHFLSNPSIVRHMLAW